MSSSVEFTIRATDKATATVLKVNEKIAKMTAKVTEPAAKLNKSLKSLGTAIGDNQVVKGLSKITRVTAGIATNVAKIAVPMTAITGAASVAGVAALATSWGRLGFEIGTTSETLGISATSLQAWRGAAALAGLSAEQMTGSLQAFGVTLQDAFYNRNTQARDLLNILGVQLHKTADGAIDTNRALLDLADVINSPRFKGQAQKQGLIGRTLSIESILPLIRKGRGAILGLAKEANDLSPFKGNAAIEDAERFNKQLNRMGLAVDGLKISIGSALLPVLEPMVKQLTEFISLNRQDIGDSVGKYAKKFGNWVKEIDVEKLNKDIKKIGGSFLWVADQINGAANALDRFNKFVAERDKHWQEESKKYGPRMELPGQSSSGKITQSLGYSDSPAAGNSTAGAGRGALPGYAGVDARKLGYNNPVLNAYAAQVEQMNKLPPGILNAIKNFGERSGSTAVSPKGAQGVMQFMPDTWKTFGVGDPTNPYNSIDAAGRYFRNMLDRYNGNLDAAVAEYNGGPSQATEVMQGRRPWKAETAHYLDRVRSAMGQTSGGSSAPQEHKLVMEVRGFPAGATVQVRDASGNTIPVRVVDPMPNFGG